MTNAQVDWLVKQLKAYNAAYRAGRPEIDDLTYDNLVERLRALDSNHPFLHTVEPEAASSGKTITHKQAMLSTDKAYDDEALERFVDRVRKAASELGVTELTFRMTPKLDGIAGNDDDGVLASRGNGRVGNDITHIFRRGVRCMGKRDLGPGEVVMVQSYFSTHLANEFKHPRNMVVGIVNADEINTSARKALEDGVVHFVPYANLVNWQGSAEELLERHAQISADLAAAVDYPLDGMVAEVTHADVKRYMGATTHHHRWQIAIKNRGETAETVIESIGWQTGRTGTVTPVLRVQPTMVSGATISNVTAHHAGMIRDKQLGPGARIEIIRSGEVIPKLERVLVPAPEVHLIEKCPSCSTPLVWDNDFLRCTNHGACPAQVETGIFYWFKTLGSADGFGPKSIAKLTAGGYATLETIYALKAQQITALGFGEKQAENLVASLKSSLETNIEDVRFLAAFGIPNLGIGDSRKLLQHYKLGELENVTAEQIGAIKGFGDKTSGAIAQSLRSRWPTISHMLTLGFNLDETVLLREQAEISSPIAGRVVMFTGKMTIGSRSEMQTQARGLGATVLSTVSSKLQILVAGEKASPAKVKKARDLGAEVMDEAQWLERIATVD